MRPVPVGRRVLLMGAVLAVVPLTACAPGTSETDRQATTLADAISYPSQTSATGFTRAALATTLGRSPDFSVIESRDLVAAEPSEPMAHLVFRIHQDGVESGWTKTDPVTACYNVDFNRNGVIGRPARTSCPDHATPIVPPPLPRWEIPGNFGDALRAALAAIPAAPSQQQAQDAVNHGLPPLPVDPETTLRSKPPTVSVATRGGDVGVSIQATGESPSEFDCLFGARLNGAVQVWAPSWRQVRPGELTCDPLTALAQAATLPPH